MDQEPSNRGDSGESPPAVPSTAQEPEPRPAAPAEPLTVEAGSLTAVPDSPPSTAPRAMAEGMLPAPATPIEGTPDRPFAEPPGATVGVPFGAAAVMPSGSPAAPPAVTSTTELAEAAWEEGRTPVAPLAQPAAAPSQAMPAVETPEAWPDARRERVAVSPDERGNRSGHVEETSHGGPNWMLAFVCAWAGGTALNEAWASTSAAKVGAQLFRSPALAGYLLLGLGFLAFAIEALRWGKRQRGIGSLLIVVLPALLTLAGVACLVLSSEPGRRI